MASITRSTAIQVIRNSLRGYPTDIISQAISFVNLPARLSNSELTSYIEKAKSFSAQREQYAKIQSQTDPRVYQPPGATGSGDSKLAANIGPASLAGMGGTTGERAASDLQNVLIQPFIDGGWENPDYWARRFLDYARPYMDGAPQKWIQQNGELISSVARRFGKNPELGWQFFTGNFTPPPTERTTITEPPIGEEGGYGFNPFASFGSGGGGGGGAAPVYVPPDRRDVEDMVRGQLARLVGQADPTRLQTLTDLYMTEHRRAWDQPSLGLNPAASVTEQIRDTSDFKRIHTLRPDFVDEDEWVTMYQQGGVQQGLTAGEAEQFAIDQATIGTRTTSIAAAAASRAFVQSGAEVPEFVNRARGAAKNLMQGVR